MCREGGGGGGGPLPCAGLSFETYLAAPRPELVPTLTAGSQLRLRLDDGGQAILADAPDGRVAGAIVPAADVMDRLADCIEQGNQFMAVVLAVSGGLVRVHVRAG